jgi:uncharacterized protein (TIGR00297 family)
VPAFLHTRLLPAAVLAMGFAVVARALGSVTDGGAMAGVLVAFVLMLAAGLAGFVPLIVVFLIALVTTRWGYARKQHLGVAERGGGRTASQVLANLGVAAICVLPTLWYPRFSEMLWIGAAAALAEAAADTASSEMGQASRKNPYMITDFREAPIGTNGAITVEGVLSGCIAAGLIAWVSAWIGLVSWRWVSVISIAGVVGMMVDSFLGATWENSGKIGNDGVNFVSTVIAADIALVAAIVMERAGA